jgi:hypothetical protein
MVATSTTAATMDAGHIPGMTDVRDVRAEFMTTEEAIDRTTGGRGFAPGMEETYLRAPTWLVTLEGYAFANPGGAYLPPVDAYRSLDAYTVHPVSGAVEVGASNLARELITEADPPDAPRCVAAPRLARPTPARLVLHARGESTPIEPGSQLYRRYATLAGAVLARLRPEGATRECVGPEAERVARTLAALEVSYAPPGVRSPAHGAYTRALISLEWPIEPPLDEHHSGIVFLGGGTYDRMVRARAGVEIQNLRSLAGVSVRPTPELIPPEQLTPDPTQLALGEGEFQYAPGEREGYRLLEVLMAGAVERARAMLPPGHEGRLPTAAQARAIHWRMEGIWPRHVARRNPESVVYEVEYVDRAQCPDGAMRARVTVERRGDEWEIVELTTLPR